MLKLHVTPDTRFLQDYGARFSLRHVNVVSFCQKQIRTAAGFSRREVRWLHSERARIQRYWNTDTKMIRFSNGSNRYLTLYAQHNYD